MVGYIGSKAVTLSTTAADVTGDATINGNLTVNGTTVTIDSAAAQEIRLGDNDKMTFGDATGGDLQIYHDGNHSRITELGTGSLLIDGDEIYLRSAAGENKIIADTNGGVNLFYDNASKLATTSTGVDITGTLTSDALNVSAASPNIDVTDTGTSHASQDFLTNSNAVRATIGVERSAGGGLFVGSSAYAAVFGTASSGSTQFATNNNVRMTIDSGGNVGIGTSSAVPLDANAQLLAIHGSAVGAERAQIKLTTTTSGQAAGDGFYIAVDDSAAYISQRENQPLVISTNAAERMRIDSSGNLLVSATTTSGFQSSSSESGTIAYAAGGIASNSPSNDVAGVFNRLGTDGIIVQLKKDGTTVGSINSRGGQGLVLNSSNSYDLGLALNGTVAFYLNTTKFYPNSDNFADLGDASLRFDDIYATNGTIQTSDQNEKQQIASLTDAEITAAKAISKLFKTFKWNDSVAEKGDAARTHSGVIAQEVQQAMTDAGLNAGDYAFFISTTWWETQTEVPAVEADEENGVEAQEAYTRTDTYDTAEEAPDGATERNRKGIRYPQLLSFIGAATEQRLASIESRLDALEGN